MRKCRIIIGSLNAGESKYLEVLEGKVGADLPQLMVDFPDDVCVYEYESPDEKFDEIIGFGKLFNNDWCAQDSFSLVQVQNPDTLQWE